MSDNFYKSMDLRYVEIAILVNTVDKYNPGIQPFYIPTLTPLKTSTGESITTPSNTTNIYNTDKNIGVTKATYGSTISIPLPKEHTRWYPTMYIPAGTKFLVVFVGGDITKPRIIGRYD